MKDKLEDTFPLVIFKSAIRVIHDDKDYIAAWVYCYNKDEPVGNSFPILTVMDLEGYDVDWDTERAVKKAAMKFRVKQIREDLGLSPDAEIRDFETIDKLLQRVWAGEWMGQFDTGLVIYFNELGCLLNSDDDWKDIWELVSKLVEARLADVLPSSWILTHPQGETPVRGSKMDGHEELEVNSSGEYWSCSACGNSSDNEEGEPKEVPCVTPISS